MRWGVVVAAGGLVKDPLASAIGTPRKALAVVHGRTCLARTLDAVREAGFADCVTVSGDDVSSEVHFGRLVAERDSQIENARAGLEALGSVEGVLFLPADSPLLSGSALLEFTKAVESRVSPGADRWLAAGLASVEEYRARFPRMSVHPVVLRDGAFLSGALYAASPPAFFHALDVLAAMSDSRKNQIKMLVKLGPWTVVRYLLHRISLHEGEERLGRFFGAQAIIVTGCDPAIAADIDEAADYDELRIAAGLKPL